MSSTLPLRPSRAPWGVAGISNATTTLWERPRRDRCLIRLERVEDVGRGRTFLSLRIWGDDGRGSLRPLLKELTLDNSEADELIAALQAARAARETPPRPEPPIRGLGTDASVPYSQSPRKPQPAA
jgi:hypothetical protein